MWKWTLTTSVNADSLDINTIYPHHTVWLSAAAPNTYRNSNDYAEFPVADNCLDRQQLLTSHPPTAERHLFTASLSLLIVKHTQFSNAVQWACEDLTFSCISEMIYDKSPEPMGVKQEAFRGWARDKPEQQPWWKPLCILLRSRELQGGWQSYRKHECLFDAIEPLYCYYFKNKISVV